MSCLSKTTASPISAKLDSLKPEIQFLVPRSFIDNANLSARLYAELEQKLAESMMITHSYKVALETSIKLDSVQENRNKKNTEILTLTDENMKEIKKRLWKNKLVDVWRKIEKPSLFILGVIVGAKVATDIITI